MLNFGAVWGIDIGDSALKAVKLKRAGKGIALLDFRVIRYSDIGGEAGARREGRLPQAVAALQQAGLGGERCIVSIAPQMVFNRFISLPPVDKRRIPEIVLYEAKQQIPFNLNEVVWAYEPIRKQFVLGEEIEIGLFAAKREVIDAYLAELSALRKQLYGVQISPLALFNFIRHEMVVEKPTVVIDVGAQSTSLLILDGQRFWLRNLPVAGNSFTAILEKRLNIPRAEAEKLKYTVSDSRHRRRLLEILRPVMRDLVAEIQRSIGYYKSLSQTVKFDEILVTGEGYKLFGLDRFLAEQLQYQITPMHELRNIVYQGDPARLKDLQQNLPSLGVAVGLGLQGLDSASATINLLPESFIIRRELHSKRFSGLIAAALIWGIVGCFYASGQQSLKAMTGIQDIGQATLKKVNDLDKELTKANLGSNPAREAALKDFGRNREFYSRIVGSISAVIPREAQINRFAFAEGTASSAVASPAPRARAGATAAAGPSPEESLVSQSGLTLSFVASCNADLQPAWLTQTFPQELAKAVLYPERIGTIKTDGQHWAIVVGPPTFSGTEAPVVNPEEMTGPGEQGRMPITGPYMPGQTPITGPYAPGQTPMTGPGAPGLPPLTAAAAPPPKRTLSASITIGLITSQEADALLKEKREKEAQETQEAPAAAPAQAAAAATTARPAAPLPVPRTPPGRRP